MGKFRQFSLGESITEKKILCEQEKEMNFSAHLNGLQNCKGILGLIIMF